MKQTKPEPGVPLRRAEKLARIPVKVVRNEPPLPKPKWLKVKLPTQDQADKVRALLRNNKLHTVCEEAACPNLPGVFQSRHRHLHDSRPGVYPAVSFLRGRAWPAATGR